MFWIVSGPGLGTFLSRYIGSARGSFLMIILVVGGALFRQLLVDVFFVSG